jgi:aspartate aminotransferase/aminotransferase
MIDDWISARSKQIDASGIRRMFELGRSMKDPIDLSIGQPDFPVPQPLKDAVCQAIQANRNGYTLTQGIPELRERILADVRQQYRHADRDVLITGGTSGGLLLAILCTVNPGDEVVIFDPYFVMYPHAVTMAGGTSVFIDTYPNFQIDLDRVKKALSRRTKMILLNSPANPTGAVLTRECVKGLAELARERNILLVSDEIYKLFCFDEPFTSAAEFNDQALVVDGYSKAYAMTGWRLGFAHGPKGLIEEMAKLQQFTFVCAPSMVQHAALAAWDCDMTPLMEQFRQRRNRIHEALREHYELVKPGGAFYAFPKAPRGLTGSAFTAQCVAQNLLVIPGKVFSQRDTHFRLSFAAAERTLERGIEALRGLGE